MKYLKISNDGILDIRLVALMGGTTKSKDQYKIGQFGTGLKYTLAFLFRNNLDFCIFAGEDEIPVTIDTELIRDETFEIICINHHRTSITTKMGEDWKAWMIIRELWSNALDEGNPMRSITSKPYGEPGKTSFFIQIDTQIQDVLDNWTKYFIHGIEPMQDHPRFAIYPGGPTRRIYKNGILIDEEDGMKSLFAYDIKNAELNELREFKGIAGYEVAMATYLFNERVAEYFLCNCTEDHWEGGDLSFEWYSQRFSKGWEAAIGQARLIYPKALQHLEESGADIDRGTMVVVPKNIFTALTKQFDHVSALRVADKVGEFIATPHPEAEGRIKQGLVILEACGLPMHPELTYEFGYFGDKKVLARVSMNEKKVYLSNTLVTVSLATIVSVLIEENTHFVTGFSDCTRELQQHFINLYTREILIRNKIEI